MQRRNAADNADWRGGDGGRDFLFAFQALLTVGTRRDGGRLGRVEDDHRYEQQSHAHHIPLSRDSDIFASGNENELL